MRARQDPVVAQLVEILADSLRRYAEPAGQRLHRHLAVLSGQLHNFPSPPVKHHASPAKPTLTSHLRAALSFLLEFSCKRTNFASATSAPLRPGKTGSR
jgi:hypothetical protein